jgi:hypothetical protein
VTPDHTQRVAAAFEGGAHLHAEPIVVLPVKAIGLLYRLCLYDARAEARRQGMRLDADVLAALDVCRRAAGVRHPELSSADGANHDTPSAASPTCTTTEAAARLGITERAVHKRLKLGRLDGHKAGGRWVVTDSRVTAQRAGS